MLLFQKLTFKQVIPRKENRNMIGLVLGILRKMIIYSMQSILKLELQCITKKEIFEKETCEVAEESFSILELLLGGQDKIKLHEIYEDCDQRLGTF